MKTLVTALLLLACAFQRAGAQSTVRYFEAVSGTDEREAIAIETHGEVGDLVEGTRWSSPEGGPVAYGRLAGRLRPDGLIHVTWYPNIEDSRHCEEGLLKQKGDTLLIGQGELEERGPTQMVLKDPSKVTFKKALKEVRMSELAIDSPEGKPLLKALSDHLEKLAGVPLDFSSGTIRVSRGWARFNGSIQPVGDKQPQSEELADKIRRCEFRGYLKQQTEGGWKLVYTAFRDYETSSDASIEQEEVEPGSDAGPAPWPLDEEVPLIDD